MFYHSEAGLSTDCQQIGSVYAAKYTEHRHWNQVDSPLPVQHQGRGDFVTMETSFSIMHTAQDTHFHVPAVIMATSSTPLSLERHI